MCVRALLLAPDLSIGRDKMVGIGIALVTARAMIVVTVMVLALLLAPDLSIGRAVFASNMILGALTVSYRYVRQSLLLVT